MARRKKSLTLRRWVKSLINWILFGLLTGVIGGLLGTGFHYALRSVTHLREENNWLIFLLPLGGLLSVAIYRFLKLQDNRGTNEVIDAALNGNEVKLAVTPAILLSTTISHLFGGSAGREGAALQLGGSVASGLGKPLRLGTENRKTLIMSGMSGAFAGIFGMPLTAALFCIEFESVNMLFLPALLPCSLAAFTAAHIAALLGVQAKTAKVAVVALSWDSLWRVAVLAVLVVLLGVVMCAVFHKAEHLAKDKVKNPWLRCLWCLCLPGGSR